MPVLFPDNVSLILPEDPRTYAPLVKRLVGMLPLIGQEGVTGWLEGGCQIGPWRELLKARPALGQEQSPNLKE